MNPYNIVYLHSHDTGRYIQPYGHAIATPNLQQLAEQGTLFHNAFCASPTCSPSRGALLTGKCPHNNGLVGLTGFGFSLNNPHEHLSHFLRTQGYETALAGLQHETESFDDLGYDHHFKTSHQAASLDSTIAFIHQPRDKPFFLTAGFFDTHLPFPEPDPDLDNPHYLKVPAPLPNTPDIRKEMAGFHAAARRVDQQMGLILNAIEDAGLSDKTIIICTTDHGIAFPHMKCNLTDHGIGVMLIIKGPKGLNAGKSVQGMVSHLDLFPTLCELIDVPKPNDLQGQSIMPLVCHEQEEIHEAIFAETNYHVSYEPTRCVRTTRYKYIRRFDDFQTPILPNTDDCPSKTFLCDNGWAERVHPRECLYDLLFDPNEACNLAKQPEMQSTLKQLQNQLTQWMTQTNDPLLFGPMVRPSNTKQMPPETYSSL